MGKILTSNVVKSVLRVWSECEAYRSSSELALIFMASSDIVEIDIISSDTMLPGNNRFVCEELGEVHDLEYHLECARCGDKLYLQDSLER